MKKLVFAAALVAGGLLGLQSVASAHGGSYRGPGDTVPAGGGGSGGGGGGPAGGPASPAAPSPTGPTAPGPVAPGTPGSAPSAAAPVTQGGGDAGPDLTLWSFWWEFNKEPYLNLKSHIFSGGTETGSDTWFLGRGQKSQGKDSLRPTPEQIRQKVVPALLAALENETNNDIVTGCLIAIAKIGDEKSEGGESEFEKVIARFLSDSNQEISETAAVALGILANDASVETLANLLQDTDTGRKLVGSTSVDYRTRSFAAYGLGLIGARTGSEEKRQEIVRILVDTIGTDDTKSRDLQVACVISMGLVPLGTIEAEPVEEGEALTPDSCRVAQLDYLRGFLSDEDNRYLVRAHVPTALVRLLADMPSERYDEYRQLVAEDLIERISRSSKEKREVQQSSIQALGLLGTNSDSDTDAAVRKALAAVPKDISDQQARNFAMVAMAKVGGTMGEGDLEAGVKETSKFLLDQLSKGKSSVQPWAGIGIGVMNRKLADAGVATASTAAMYDAVRDTLRGEKDTSKIGAYALAVGIMADVESTEILLDKLERLQDDTARGYVAVALGLMNSREAVDPIQTIVKESKYRPDLLKQAAIGLGLLGDKALVEDLITMLNEAKGLATQAAISSALGFIGDQRSIDPLVAMLENPDLTDRARGFAAVALGIVADKEPLPWNTKIALDLNYRASTQTLVDQQSGTGILDIL